ncbi:hypothetical protein E4T47_05653 [Aureobasidium subglaciale]|nr:hypothetical protein E4T47_05653 [Aureobasidium subglaciale]
MRTVIGHLLVSAFLLRDVSGQSVITPTIVITTHVSACTLSSTGVLFTTTSVATDLSSRSLIPSGFVLSSSALSGSVTLGASSSSSSAPIVSSSISTASSSSTAAPSAAPQCGQPYSGSNGTEYQIACGQTYDGDIIAPSQADSTLNRRQQSAPSFEACIESCETLSQCVVSAFLLGECTLLSAITRIINTAEAVAAIRAEYVAVLAALASPSTATSATAPAPTVTTATQGYSSAIEDHLSQKMSDNAPVPTSDNTVVYVTPSTDPAMTSASVPAYSSQISDYISQHLSDDVPIPTGPDTVVYITSSTSSGLPTSAVDSSTAAAPSETTTSLSIASGSYTPGAFPSIEISSEIVLPSVASFSSSVVNSLYPKFFFAVEYGEQLGICLFEQPHSYKLSCDIDIVIFPLLKLVFSSSLIELEQPSFYHIGELQHIYIESIVFVFQTCLLKHPVELQHSSKLCVVVSAHLVFVIPDNLYRNRCTHTCAELRTPGVNDCSFNPALEFVPLLYNSDPNLLNNWASAAQIAIDNGSTALMSFNEPDFCVAGSACMSVDTAVRYHRQYMQPFAGKALIGAPAVTNAGGTDANPQGLQYLQYFLGNCTDCTIDFINLHWYSNKYAGASYFESHINSARAIAAGRPIWITEFGLNSEFSYTDAELQAFLQKVMPWLDQQQDVARYAYFMDAPGILINSAGNAISGTGNVYNSFTNSTRQPTIADLETVILHVPPISVLHRFSPPPVRPGLSKIIMPLVSTTKAVPSIPDSALSIKWPGSRLLVLVVFNDPSDPLSRARLCFNIVDIILICRLGVLEILASFFVQSSSNSLNSSSSPTLGREATEKPETSSSTDLSGEIPAP